MGQLVENFRARFHKAGHMSQGSICFSVMGQPRQLTRPEQREAAALALKQFGALDVEGLTVEKR